MSMTTTTTISCSLISSLHVRSCRRFHPSFSGPISHLSISKHNSADGCSFPAYQSSQYLSTGQTAQSGNRPKMDFVVHNADQLGDLIPFGDVLDSWKNWIPGMLIALIVPFFTNKWGPFAKLKEEADKVEATVDNIADVVEEVAEKVEKVVEDIEEGLPEGGMLKNTLTYIDNAAKEVAKDAQLVEDMVDKVEEVEKKVESIVEKVTDKSQTTAKVE